MVTGALLDLGAPEQELRKQLATLPLEGYTIEIKKEWKQGHGPGTPFFMWMQKLTQWFFPMRRIANMEVPILIPRPRIPEIHGILEGSQLSPPRQTNGQGDFFDFGPGGRGNPRPTGRPGGLAGSGSGGFHCGCGRRGCLRGFVGGG